MGLKPEKEDITFTYPLAWPSHPHGESQTAIPTYNMELKLETRTFAEGPMGIPLVHPPKESATGIPSGLRTFGRT
jgi:hypothetical protein